MAFCKYCGKEIPEGGLCGCPGAIHKQQAENVFGDRDAFQQEADENPNSITESVLIEKKKAESRDERAAVIKSALEAARKAAEGPSVRKANLPAISNESEHFKKFAAVVIAAVAVFVLIVFSLAAGSGYKGTVKRYFRSRCSKHGGSTYYSLTLPDDGIKELRRSGQWSELVSTYNDDISERMGEWKKRPRFGKISKVTDMKNSEIKNAEKYFLNAADVCGKSIEENDLRIGKGYSVTYTYRNTEGKNDKTTIYVVKISGEGWKVMNGQGTAFYGFEG